MGMGHKTQMFWICYDRSLKCRDQETPLVSAQK